ncbi:MAG: hypothetical protein J6B52_00825 [Clostridia bacterium]|nr:hypothetical protein [Clostridia bacterium]
MIQYFLDRPYLIIILIAVLALTVFVCIKAGQASAKRSQVNQALMKKLKEENLLRNEFSILTESLAAKAQTDRLFKGVALNLQKRISDAADMNAEFDSLTQEQREIYGLSFVIEDGGEALSAFFRTNGQPLTGAAYSAMERIIGGRAFEIFDAEYKAFDPENEEASYEPEKTAVLDGEFLDVISENELCTKAGNYIKANVEKFLV